ncbi:hypothetical protein [Tabrizicola sp.]|uniref:hypothetical protein n=1 Tax=Tabrizicola sp. TaxID=2005166 RepID=UPI003F2D2B65
MLTRMRLLKGATALLYIGPLFAGLCGLGVGLVAPFVAIFIVWLMVLRPEQWPVTPDEWLTGQAWLAALTQVLSQLLLVLVLFGIGRGLGGISGFDFAINPIVPLTISFLAIPTCRMLWDAREAADQGYFLDEEAEEAHALLATADAGQAIVPVLNLPDNATDVQVADALAKGLDSPNVELRLRALDAALTKPDRSHAALRRGLVLWASEPEVVAPGHVPNAMSLAHSIAGNNPDLLRLYVPRALALISAFPERAAGFPTLEQLRASAASLATSGSDLPRHLMEDLREGLLALAQAVDAARAKAEPQPEAAPIHDVAPGIAVSRA